MVSKLFWACNSVLKKKKTTRLNICKYTYKLYTFIAIFVRMFMYIYIYFTVYCSDMLCLFKDIQKYKIKNLNISFPYPSGSSCISSRTAGLENRTSLLFN